MKKSEEEATTSVCFPLYRRDVETSLSRRMEGNGFPRQVSIFYLEIRGPILDDDHDVATILDFLLFISAAAQWTGLAIHISYFATRSLLPAPHSPHRRRWIIFFSLRSYRSPTCSFTETMFFVAQLPPCVSPLWSDVPRVNLRRDCVPALHGRGSLACWYFPSEFSRKKRKKKNEFRPCFFNYNFIVARERLFFTIG